MWEQPSLFSGFFIKAFLFPIILFSFLPIAFAQFSIKGDVKDDEGLGIFQASVSLLGDNNNYIAYQYTDKKGIFIFANLDSAKLSKIKKIEVNSFGFEKKQVMFEKGETNYSIILNKHFKELSEVKVSGEKRVISKGDTTVYNVGSFAGEEDRSIGEVISKLPGMSVSKDGTITYKDKKIEGLYIEGDDLMGANYGLATNVISKEMIRSIEVIERFQPVRVLQGKVETQNVGINLVLQNANAIKMSGQAELGVGLPGITDINIHAMVFNKKIKTLNAIKYNNSGHSYLNQKFEDLVRDEIVDNPGIPEEYINDNHSFLVSTNYLNHFKDTVQLKTNIQYIRDQNSSGYYSLNENYLINDTIAYHENQVADKVPQVINVSFALEQNKSNRYWSDNFFVSLGGAHNSSLLNFNADHFDQNLVLKSNVISNSLIWMPAFKRRDTYTINWNWKYQQHPHSLLVGKGIDSVFFNNGVSYESIFQRVNKSQFLNKLELAYFINDRKLINKSIYAGVENQFQQLRSGLLLKQWDGFENDFEGDAGNNVRWQEHRSYLKGVLFIRKSNLIFNLSVPITYLWIIFRQPRYLLNQHKNNIFINPNLWIQYFFNDKNSVYLTYVLKNEFGSINDVYRGSILNSFKVISNNESDIQERRQNLVKLNYNYSDKINLIEFDLGVTFDHLSFNSIYSTEYEKNMIKRVLLPKRNMQSNISYTASLNKYVFFLKSKLEVSAGFTQSRTNQFVNNSFLPYLNQNLNVRFTAGVNLIENVSFYYSGSVNWFNGKPRKQEGITREISGIRIFNHHYSFVFTPKAPVNIILRARQQINFLGKELSIQYFFADFKTRYLHKKWRTEFELGIDNIFDVTRFGTFYINTNQFYSSNFQLRGRMIMLKAIFTF